jgi:hypothetical protein
MDTKSEELEKQYQGVLKDLEARRASYVSSINELDVMIAGISRQIQARTGIAPTLASQAPVSTASPNESQRFAHMSVRWAILKLLAAAERPVTTGEIAKALEAGGVESKGQRFSSIVSAVLSDMKSKKEEVESVEDGCYRLTSQGREAWEHIEQSARYRYREQGLTA